MHGYSDSSYGARSISTVRNISWTCPPRLGPGARVALVAPAGPLRDEGDLERAVSNVRSFGWEAVPGRAVMQRDGYFAGPDAARAADLNRALEDKTIDAIWFLRGGYGCTRILSEINYEAIKRRPIALIGYSDITAIHSAVSLRCNLITYHGPTARAVLSQFTRESFKRAVVDGSDPCGSAIDARVIRPGSASGRLQGGNLAVLASLAGTPFAQSFDGAILLLEDVNEAVYRVDRMLLQLLLSGALNGCRAIVFGHCTDCPEERPDIGGARTIDAVLAEVANRLKVPCVSGVPLGHIDDQWTIPHGAIGQLDANASGVTLTVSQ